MRTAATSPTEYMLQTAGWFYSFPQVDTPWKRNVSGSIAEGTAPLTGVGNLLYRILPN